MLLTLNPRSYPSSPQDAPLLPLEEENVRICAHITLPHLSRSLFRSNYQPSSQRKDIYTTDSDSGSESNEHNEFGCFIVPDGTTKCPAPTGISCNDRAYLAVSLQKALTNKSSVTRWHNIFRYLTIWNNKYLAIVCSSFQKLSKRYQIVQNS